MRSSRGRRVRDAAPKAASPRAGEELMSIGYSDINLYASNVTKLTRSRRVMTFRPHGVGKSSLGVGSPEGVDDDGVAEEGVVADRAHPEAFGYSGRAGGCPARSSPSGRGRRARRSPTRDRRAPPRSHIRGPRRRGVGPAELGLVELGPVLEAGPTQETAAPALDHRQQAMAAIAPFLLVAAQALLGFSAVEGPHEARHLGIGVQRRELLQILEAEGAQLETARPQQHAASVFGRRWPSPARCRRRAS